MRGWPNWNTSRTAVCATTDPNAITPDCQRAFGATEVSATDSDLSRSPLDHVLKASKGTGPVNTAATATYRTVQTIKLAIIPIGKSRAGFFVSSATVETASNPM